jgi:hypothetical protein
MPKTKGNNLPSLQKMIVLHLSENDPQTMHKTAQTISKHYKPTWTAFKSLETKKLIKKTSIKEHAGRKYPSYWLTDEGIIMALMEGANSNKLLKQAKTLYPENKNVHWFLEIAPLFDPQVIKMAHSSLKGKDKLGVREIITLYLSQPSVAMDLKTAKKLTAILKKYPDEYKILKNAVKEMINQLNQLIAE